MKTNVLRRIEVGDVAILKNNQYSRSEHNKYYAVFANMKNDGLLEGEFSGSKWMGFSGVKRFGIDFSLNEEKYNSHFGRKYGISYKTMEDMIRCYALYIIGAYIFPTINERIAWIKLFATKIGDKDFRLPIEAEDTIIDFLCFISTPENEIVRIQESIHFTKAGSKRQRKLAHMINYLAIANEIKDLYSTPLPANEFKKWFPIFFWSNITFILPLRATEMLLTPYACISIEKDKKYITVRRTMLKEGRRNVHYQVEEDYKEFKYEVPDNWTIEIIERYQEMTSANERNYLFEHTKYMINDMVSLQSFNLLLADFINTHLIGNRKYDYAKYATGIKEFEIVTAGDSRPIAMANLYFQDISADICRQLANHSQVSTSFGYYTNVSNTIQCASIMQVQRRINRERSEVDAACAVYTDKKMRALRDQTLGCLSPAQPLITGNITDCIKENHLHECMGCQYYAPSESELKKEVEKRKQKLDAISKQLVEYIADVRVEGKKNIDTDKLFLDTHTGAVRLKCVSDEYAEEAEKKWRRHKSTKMQSF